MQVKAKASGIKSTPRKMGLVAALVRKRSIEDALTILEHTPKKAASQLATVIKSAKANAENNHKMGTEGLQLESILVSPGPVLKRWRAAAFGAAHNIRKRSSNVTVIVSKPEAAESANSRTPVKSKPTRKASHGSKS